MTKTTVFKNIGFGDYADAVIEIEEVFTPSNDYEGTYIIVDGEEVANASGTIEAINKAFGGTIISYFLLQNI